MVKLEYMAEDEIKTHFSNMTPDQRKAEMTKMASETQARIEEAIRDGGFTDDDDGGYKHEFLEERVLTFIEDRDRMTAFEAENYRADVVGLIERPLETSATELQRHTNCHSKYPDQPQGLEYGKVINYLLAIEKRLADLEGFLGEGEQNSGF